MQPQGLLEQLGFHPFFAAQWQLLDGAERWVPARVSADSGDIYELAGCRARFGQLAGRLRHPDHASARPTTGDWVAVSDDDDNARIHLLLDRRSALVRRAAGKATHAQVVAANVDVFFLVTAADRDLNPRRLERYLAAVWDSGAQPVIVVNKIDLVDEDEAARALHRVEAIAGAASVAGVSAMAGSGVDALAPFLGVGATVGLIGSSGVGKSTLSNRLLGDEMQAAAATRGDGKGRHTTTRRELRVLPGGGVLIDTPGMREFGMLGGEGGLEVAFAELAEVAARCRFRDCTHDDEPGCAVLAAVAEGELGEERVRSYRRLRRERAANEARRDPVQASNSKRRWKAIHKQVRNLYKDSDKYRR
ncbi:ribosome small subunit-dependent GTPase A [Haliangium ochraceum]|uniref:Small ribosomal subunit biogenesis GTPase RsgA n=1 Tax=Haliangium ochraceum (strain DSM 14365 / JCM 11303 / SMP-2) TaxID=502025 RepID=D0LXL5_HALO1|nr:ribosome small subunit-dependent GTPase A [Haliangium ochraceum]ACY17770.1 GTPase EngC [Haliangium ochraceum DSM 14365]